MLNQSEREILSTYQKLEDIDVRSYLTDFIMKNPTNFPISSHIMKFSKISNYASDDTTLKDAYSRNAISVALGKMFSNGNSGVLVHMIDAFEQECFTTLLMLLNFRDKKNFNDFGIITEVGNDYILYFSNKDMNILITTDFGDVIVMNKNKFQKFVIGLNNRTFANLGEYDEFLKNYTHYRFPVGLELTEAELPNEKRYRFSLFIALLSGTQYIYRNKMQDIYPGYETILKYCFDYDGICSFIREYQNQSNEFLYECKTTNQTEHVEEVADFGLLNKKIAI